MPARKTAIRLVVDREGIEVEASLRPPRSAGDNYQVRFKWDGVQRDVTTRTRILAEAKRVARLIVRGEPITSPSVTTQRGMTPGEFEQIQREYHGSNRRREAGESTLVEFMGVWRSFLRVCPVGTIQEVTDRVALAYLRRLEGMSKTENRKSSKKKSPERLAIKTIQKHIRTLAGAWNLCRDGHKHGIGGLPDHQILNRNPWEAIRRRIPQDPNDLEEQDPVQFELVDNDLGKFLDQFQNRPVGELFIITSLWCWGRIKEMTRIQWDWIQDAYVVIPNPQGKKGRGKVARLPPAILERLIAIREPDSPYVFARWGEEFKSRAKRPSRVLPFSPDRMLEQMESLIPSFAEAIGRREIGHHALRKTAMELGEEAELRLAEKTSAEKLQTSLINKRRNYTKKYGKKAFTFADGLYANLTTALHDYPALATRLGCEPLAILAEREAEVLLRKLTPIQRQRLGRQLLGGDAEGDGQGVAG